MVKFTEEQLQAINKRGSNILVSAGAGSGKTAVLSERVLNLIKEGTSISDLLILTFTNLAAAEMKERIRKKIKEDDSLKEEYEKIESSYITTFDSFCYSVVKQYHYLLNLPSNIKITDESVLSVIKEELLEKLFTKYYDKENIDFQNILKNYFVKDDKQFKKFILEAYERIDLIYEKEEFLNNYVNKYYDEVTINKLIADYMGLLNRKIEKIDYLVDEISSYDNDYYIQISLIKESPRLNYKDIKFISEIKLPDLPRGSSEELKKLKPELKDELDDLKELTKYEDINELSKEYIYLKDIIKSTVNIIKDFDEEYKSYKIKNNLYNFLDIEKLAISIVQNNDDVRLYYKEKFKEILIDEYQDTSDIQETLINLISNNNVYMVGDIKQSIYKFRNANPYIFKEKFDQYGNNVGGKRIDLNKNFRSNEHVINFVNNVFNIIMDEYIGEANYRLEHNLIYGNTLYDKLGLNQDGVEILNYEYDKKGIYKKDEIEIFIVAKDIQNKINKKVEIYDKELNNKRAIKYSDISILLDRSTNFDLYKKIFEYLKIPLIINRDVIINDNVNIKVIKNIYNLINKIYLKKFDNSFKRSFYSVGRSFLFEYSDTYLYEVIEKDLCKETELYESLLEFTNLIEELSIYELLKRIIYKYNFYDKFIKLGDIDNNNVALEYLLKLTKDNENVYSIEDFINYLELVLEEKIKIQYKTNQNTNGVNLMTIHGSKGLEFPVLYISHLDKRFNLQDVKDRFVFDKEYGFIMPVIGDNLTTLFTKRLLKDRYTNEELSERIRLLYVALTRAKEKLILVSNITDDDYNKDLTIDKIKSRSHQSFLNFTLDKSKNIKLINVNDLNITGDYKYSKKEDLTKLLDDNNKKLQIESLNIRSEIEERKTFSKGEVSLFNKNIKDNISFGNKVHHIFEQIDFKNPNLENIPENIKIYVNNFMKLDILKDGINYYKEYDFLYEEDNLIYRGSIDLLVEKEDKFVVIDYKLKNIDDEDYYDQLKGYKKYIEGLTNKKVDIYLYSIVDNNLKEVN